MRTLAEWANSLPYEETELQVNIRLALSCEHLEANGAGEFNENDTHSTLRDAIDSFLWSSSPQGHTYWERVMSRVDTISPRTPANGHAPRSRESEGATSFADSFHYVPYSRPAQPTAVPTVDVTKMLEENKQLKKLLSLFKKEITYSAITIPDDLIELWRNIIKDE